MRKKDTLYTANKWNKPLFAPRENLFWGDPSRSSQMQINPNNPFNISLTTPTVQQRIDFTDPVQKAAALGTTKGLVNGFKGIAETTNPFSASAPVTTGAKGLVGGLGNVGLGMLGSIGNTLAKNLISDGYDAGGVGNAVADIGNQVGGLVSNIPGVGTLAGTAVQFASGLVGGTINRAFGKKTDEEALKSAKEGINYFSNFNSNVSSLDDIQGPQAMANFRNPFKGGWFKSAAKDNDALKQQFTDAKMYADRSVTNNVNNLTSDQLNDELANYTAFGGPIDTIGGDMGAIGYDFMSDYLTMRNRQAEQKDKLTNMFIGTPSGLFAEGGGIHIKPSHRGRLTELKERTGKTEAELYNDGNPAHKKMVVFARNARKWKHADGGFMNVLYHDAPLFAFGGDMQTNGADYGTGLTHVSAGSSHEENPYDGVQMGVDPEGIPNLVEENETVWNDYVFSARINADEKTKEKFHLPKKKDITYADISKKLEKEIKERPNDPLSQAGFKAQMEELANQQERQKAEMEAERAKATFEALSPEEQTAIMQRAAQEEAMAQEAAQQEALAAQQQAVNEEQVALNQQQEAAISQPEVIGQEPQQFAEGGHLFPWGGLKELFGVKPPYAASKTAGFIPYTRDLTEEEVLKREEDPVFKAWTQYVNDNWDTDEVQSYLRDLDAAAGGNHLFDKEGKILPKAKDYFNHARTGNHKWGYYHLTPQQLAEEAAKEAAVEKVAAAEPRVFHALEGDDDYIQGELSPEVGAETRRVTLDNGDTVIYHDRKPHTGKTPAEVAAETGLGERKDTPRLRAEWPRYAGLFGPAVGLGLQMAGVGKPDTGLLDAAIEDSGNVALADYKPLGDYLTYRPMDIWFEQAKMDAQARATDKALTNTISPSKAAGLLANGYNSQLASGELYRKALEYNDAKRKDVAEFNRGTNQFNSEAYNKNSQFNADAINRALQHKGSLSLQAAREKMDADAGWYNGIYGNLSGLFKGLSDLGRENAQWNMIARNAADGVYGNLGDSWTSEPVLDKDKRKKKAACGGKLKKGKKRGLTI